MFRGFVCKDKPAEPLPLDSTETDILRKICYDFRKIGPRMSPKLCLKVWKEGAAHFSSPKMAEIKV